MKTTVLLVILAAVGCNSWLDVGVPQLPHRDGGRGVWIEPGISQTAVMRGCEMWSVDCAIAQSPDSAKIVVKAGTETDCSPASDGVLWLASGTNVSNEVTLRMACWPNVDTDWDQFTQMAAVVAHEIGHTMGLVHLPEPGAVMHASVPSVTELTAADRAEFRRVHGGELH